MALADFATTPAPPGPPAPQVDARAALDAIPRAYNFAADIIGRNLEAGRAGKASVEALSELGT